MHTLFDFMTHVKGVEYLISIAAIAVFLIFWEVLKPRPFSNVVTTGRQDLEHLKQSGSTTVYLGKIAAAPFIGLAYIIMLPVGFFFVVLSEAVNLTVKGVSTLLGKDISFDWRPLEAYFTGRRNKPSDAGIRKDQKK